jgi:hypothetical protein
LPSTPPTTAVGTLPASSAPELGISYAMKRKSARSSGALDAGSVPTAVVGGVEGNSAFGSENTVAVPRCDEAQERKDDLDFAFTASLPFRFWEATGRCYTTFGRALRATSSDISR